MVCCKKFIFFLIQCIDILNKFNSNSSLSKPCAPVCTRGVSASWMLRAWRTRIGTKVIRMAFLFSVPQTTVLLLLLLLPYSLPTVATAAAALSTSVYLVVFQLVKLQACPQFRCIMEQSPHEQKLLLLSTCY